MKAMWVPIVLDGETWYSCSIEAFGVVATAKSRTKKFALIHALQVLTSMVADNEVEIPS